jgi:hypothetical protein
MPVAMTLEEARTVPQVTDDDVATLEAEAAEAEDAAATLERSAVDGAKGSAAPGAVVEARAVAEFARKRATAARARADRATAARRLIALGVVAADTEALAARATDDKAGFDAAMRKVADGVAEARALAAGHDEQVAELARRAAGLGVEPAAPAGPRASSAHVAVSRTHMVAGHAVVRSGATVVQQIGPRVDEAIALAAGGDPGRAAGYLAAARTEAAPHRHDRYYVGGGGAIHGADDGTTHGELCARQAAKGEMRELTSDEVTAYLAGRFDGHQKTGA